MLQLASKSTTSKPLYYENERDEGGLGGSGIKMPRRLRWPVSCVDQSGLNHDMALQLKSYMNITLRSKDMKEKPNELK